MRMRIERVTDFVPHDGLVVVRRKAGVLMVELNAQRLTEAQALKLDQWLRKDPDLLRAICDADV
ncbi:hypothetical protein [Kitasatospora sp. NPDC057738]|uniref:hypothetical protein n=1 Tax=Kitasatospora sp. NPDC057738 TaxID=3346233 RepID=UPI0036B2C3FA